MAKLQQEMQQYQAEMSRYERDIAAKQAEIFKQFDENGDGRLFGPERSKYDRHMYQIRIGKQPNPFATVRLPGQPASPQSASTK